MKDEQVGGVILVNNKAQIKQIEFLIGKNIPLKIKKEIGSLSHLTMGNEWILKVLDKMGKKVSDIIYEQDRKILQDEFKENKKYQHLL